MFPIFPNQFAKLFSNCGSSLEMKSNIDIRDVLSKARIKEGSEFYRLQKRFDGLQLK